jgi:hypothetical protein
MTNVVRFVFVSCLASLLSAPALTQQAVAPSHRPADSGPSLAFTLKFIQDKIAVNGKINFVSYANDNSPNPGFLSIQGPTDGTTPFIFEESNVVAHPNVCGISYHVKTIKDGATVADNDWEIPFNLIQRVMVMTLDQRAIAKNDAFGRPSLDSRIDSPLYVLIAQRTGGATNTVYFSDEDTANSVAKAMIHAAELCDDSNNNPLAPSTQQSEAKAQIPPQPPRPMR